MAVMAACKEQGGQHGQQRKKIFHGSLTCWRICLSVPVAGLAGTAGSGVIPYAIDQQVGREFAIQAVCLAQFRLKSRDFGSSLVKLPLQIRLGRGEPASRDMGPSSQYSHSGRTSGKFSRIVGRCSQMFFWLFSVSHWLNFWG
ncbi:hypothetical protein [Desulfovibrio piger]|uniref:hypothetical protein n=1 Tax=Desulfovibrio piger TaxID=901 RepID=UPI0026F33A07|nr:hypothetical protein [Desulfovibrio piger]